MTETERLLWKGEEYVVEQRPTGPQLVRVADIGTDREGFKISNGQLLSGPFMIGLTAELVSLGSGEVPGPRLQPDHITPAPLTVPQTPTLSPLVAEAIAAAMKESDQRAISALAVLQRRINESENNIQVVMEENRNRHTALSAQVLEIERDLAELHYRFNTHGHPELAPVREDGWFKKLISKITAHFRRY